MQITASISENLTNSDLESGREIFRSLRIQGQKQWFLIKHSELTSNDLEDHGQGQFQGLHRMPCLISYSFCRKIFS